MRFYIDGAVIIKSITKAIVKQGCQMRKLTPHVAMTIVEMATTSAMLEADAASIRDCLKDQWASPVKQLQEHNK